KAEASAAPPGRKRIMKALTGLMLALGLAGAARAGAMIAIPGDPVKVQGGPVAGTRLDSGVKAYLGVPFAKPPVDELRWRAPQPIAWKGVWNADRKGPEC